MRTRTTEWTPSLGSVTPSPGPMTGRDPPLLSGLSKPRKSVITAGGRGWEPPRPRGKLLSLPWPWGPGYTLQPSSLSFLCCEVGAHHGHY